MSGGGAVGGLTHVEGAVQVPHEGAGVGGGTREAVRANQLEESRQLLYWQQTHVTSRHLMANNRQLMITNVSRTVRKVFKSSDIGARQWIMFDVWFSFDDSVLTMFTHLKYNWNK